MRSDMQVLEQLLDMHADVNMAYKDESTPLVQATLCGVHVAHMGSTPRTSLHSRRQAPHLIVCQPMRTAGPMMSQA
jgi:hypothetical protein